MTTRLCFTPYFWVLAGEDAREIIVQNINIQSGPIPEENKMSSSPSSQVRELEGGAVPPPPPPPPPLLPLTPPPTPAFFTGYKLPPGNPCEGFTLPPPPADKKRTGPRREFEIFF